jgi:hypothetical protein
MGDDRELILEQAAHGAGRSWTQACSAQLTREGRRLEGGWPGTMREARTRAVGEAGKLLAARKMTALTHEELERLTRITWEEARRAWNAVVSSNGHS